MMDSMTKHEDLERLLAAYFEGTLATDEKDRFEAHYLDCEICTAAIHRAIDEREMIDRYTLNKLAPGELEFFEKHYFACHACFAAVKEAEYLISGLRYAAQENQLAPAPLKSSWLIPAQELIARFKPAPFSPAIAFAVLALLLLYPAWRGVVELPRLERALTALQRPQAHSQIFALEQTRQGEKQLVEIPPPDAPPSTIILQLPPADKTSADSHFRAALIDESSGKTIWEEEELRSAGEYAIFAISCPSSFFRPGRYSLKVEEVDHTGAKILQRFDYPFEVTHAE